MYNSANPKLLELMANKEFVVSMLSQETPEDVQRLFADNGVEFTMDEIHEIGSKLAELEEKYGSDEISEEELMNVVGGSVTVAAVIWGAVRIGVALGGLGLAVYKWYKSR